ncbi:hypothetical protein EDB81DRAFT_448309 [Dactylonectria macrodidyma]|uniref:Uncharacterized protein n=1 Tax=Dactylonectria macrodidyma TaxID=307937 RepID=A0A9P9F6C5_9HYPO|nr:hypothetical protein EDB81DRAFT_448309 [Dactylonectria macrodidyma]
MCGTTWLPIPTVICYHYLSFSLPATRIYIMRFSRLCWTLLHQVSNRISHLCWVLSITISYLHRAHGLIHSTDNATCALRKPSPSMTPSMSKPYADIGGNICEPCHASRSVAHLRYTKGCKKTAFPTAYNSNIATCYPQLLSPPPVFTPEDQLYLRHRLPLRKPTTARTVRLHFAQLTLVYQDLAEQSLARAAMMVPGPARERRLRMGNLATRLARRYCGYRLVLSDEIVKSVMRLHANGAKRPSRVWEAVLDEIEVHPSSALDPVQPQTNHP